MVAIVRQQGLQRVILAATMVALFMVAGALALVGWATTSIDAVEKAKEEALVQRRLDRSLENIVDDVNSAAIWNDTVSALTGPIDTDWLQVNLGDYYADYMDHAATLVWGPSGDLVLASRDSEPVPPDSEGELARAVAPLVQAVGAASRAPARRGAVGFAASVNRSGVVRVEGRPWLVAVATIVPEDREQARPPVDPIVASGLPIDALITSLDEDLAIQDARFADAAQAGQASVAVTSRSGERLGVIAWTPERPGASLLRDAAVIMAAVLLLLGVGATILFVWIGRVARALAANEEELTRARDRAEAANEAKSRFLANMSHELRTPLNGVVGLAEVMAAGDLNPVQRVHLDLIRSAGQSLTRLIEQILQVARLERDEVLIQRTPFDPAATLAAAVEAQRQAATKKKLSLVCRAEPMGRRHGDEGHLRQVLCYLIENAVTYTNAGQVTVTAAPHGDAVRFTVADTGPGIRKDLLPTLFDVFVQGDDSLTKKHEGAGLGLAICRNLVEAMGGRLSVDTEEGRGSTFTVDLPLPPAQADHLERRAA